MTTDLDFGGHDIVNVGNTRARTIIPQTTLQVGGQTDTDDLDGSTASRSVDVTGDLAVDGMVTVVTMTSTGYEMNGNDVEVANDIDGNRLTGTGKMTVKGDMQVTANLTTPNVKGDITTDAMSMVTLESTATTVQGDVIVNRASTETVKVSPTDIN